jgi:hypothetical protein
MTMPKLADIVAAVKENATSDYVGMWEIHSMLKEDFGPHAATPEQIVAVVRQLLEEDHVLGQFQDRVFREWPGSSADQLGKLVAELSSLGHSPDIGEVAWLAKR